MQYYHNMTIAYNAYIYFPLTITETLRCLFSGIVSLQLLHYQATICRVNAPLEDNMNWNCYESFSFLRLQWALIPLMPEVKIYPKQNIIMRWEETFRCNKTPQI